MITNETRAKLIGWGEHTTTAVSGLMKAPDGHVDFLPQFDADANAVAELRAFVRARGKWFEFISALDDITSARPELYSFGWDILNATPQQQTTAFDAVFRDDLERISER
jgi:hypothetical protein